MNRKSITKRGTLSLTTALAIGSLSVNAETFELRMAVEAVPGAADIERGDIDKGIRRLERALTESHPAGAVATNLCAAFTMRRDCEGP